MSLSSLNGSKSQQCSKKEGMQQPAAMQHHCGEARFHRSDSQEVLDYLHAATSGPAHRTVTSENDTTDKPAKACLLRELSCDETMSDQDVKSMQELLHKNHRHVNLSVLRLPRNQLSPASAPHLAKIIQSTETLIHLDLRHNQIGPSGVEELVEPLMAGGENGSTLRCLNLMDNALGHKAAKTISRLLKNNDSLKELHLGMNHLGAKGMKSIAAGLKQNTTLETLDLSHNEGQQGVQIILKSLASHNQGQLSFVNLSANQLGVAGIKAVRDLIQSNHTIQRLDLSTNHLGPAGANQFLPALLFPNTLVELDFGNNEIGDQGVEALAKGLQQEHCHLQRLSLAYNFIRDDGARKLSEALQQNTTLVSLDLSHNSIESPGACYLANAISYNFCLKEIDLSWNKIDDEGAVHLAQAMARKNCPIDALNWDRNDQISEEGHFLLQHACRFRESRSSWLGRLLDDLERDRVIAVDWWKLPDRYSTVTDFEVEALARHLGKYKPQNLQSLYLTGKHITDRSISILSEKYLSNNPSLQRLYIKDISMKSAGFQAMSAALRQNSTLRILSLVDCGLSVAEAGTDLVRLLWQNDSLERLVLQGNGLGDEGFLMLWPAINDPHHNHQHPSLRSLNVSDNDLTDASMAAIAETIAVMALHELHLDGNEISDRGALDLAKTIMDSPSLKWLSMTRNPRLTYKGKNALRLFAPKKFMV